MLRRLLSSPLSMNGKVMEDEFIASTDEPKEYFILSKMQPLPPEEEKEQEGYLQNNYWCQSNFGCNNNSNIQFSNVTGENDVYWPNCIPIGQYNNDNITSISSSTPILPSQPPPLLFSPSSDLIVHQMPSNKINILEESKFQNNYNSNNNISFELNKGGLQLTQDVDINRKMSTNSTNKDLLERNVESPFFNSDTNQSFFCRYCNRSFPRCRISHRRHVAQCRRLNLSEDVVNNIGGGGGSSSCSSNTAFTEILGSKNLKFQQKNNNTSTIDFSSLNNNNSCSSSSPTPPAPGGIGSVDPCDPYQCNWCQFNTLYKGNMKRHLICCHQVSLELLTTLNFNIERLRKLSTLRPSLDELPIQPRRDGKYNEEENGGGEYFLQQNNYENNLNNNNNFEKKIKTPKNNNNFNKRKISTEKGGGLNNNKIIKIEQKQINLTTNLNTSNNNYYNNNSSSTIRFAPYI